MSGDDVNGIIRLLDSSGTKTLDSISCMYEDSFTIETFGDLIKSHQNVEPRGTKNFIIARVQTWDPKQPNRAFYSYYAAHHLNKILFQTQVYLNKKLIHRLHVLNPLTNSDIVGCVQYFMVCPTKDKPTSQAKQGAEASARAAATRPEAGGGLALEAKSLASRSETLGAVAPDSDGAKKLKGISKLTKLTHLSLGSNAGGATSTPLEGLPPPSSHVREAEKNQIADWTLNTPLVNEMAYEEGNTGEQRSLGFWKKQKPPSAPSPFDSQSYAAPQVKSDAAASSLNSSPGADGSKGAKPVLTNSNADEKKRRVRSAAPPGLVTRFGKPVDDSDEAARPVTAFQPSSPLSARSAGGGQRLEAQLNYSFANSARPDENGKVRTFAEWLDRLQPATNGEVRPSEGNEDTSDRGKVEMPTSPSKRVVLQIVNAINKQELTVLIDKPPNSNAGVADPSSGADGSSNLDENSALTRIAAFDALLFATDNDFLEQSKIRSLFKKHALTDSDAALFEMPAIDEAMHQEFVRRRRAQNQRLGSVSQNGTDHEGLVANTERRPSLQPLSIEETVIPSADLENGWANGEQDTGHQLASLQSVKQDCHCLVQ